MVGKQMENPLVYVVGKGGIELAQILLEAGADVNAPIVFCGGMIAF